MQRLKRYQGPTTDEVYARVREECGGDAEVVSSRTVHSPGLFGAPPSEYVEVVVRVSDEDLERRKKLAARLAAARAEAAAVRALETMNADGHANGRGAAGAIGPTGDDEDTLAPPFLNELAGSGVVPGDVARPSLLGRLRGGVADMLGARDDADALAAAPFPEDAAAGPFAALNAGMAFDGGDALAAPDVPDAADASRALPFDAPSAGDRSLLAGVGSQLAEIHALLRQLALDRVQDRIDGVPDGLGASRARLLEQGVPPALVATVLEQAAQALTRAGDGQAAQRTVERKLAGQLPAVARVDFARRPVVLFLVGPAGAGKTTMAMRLALDIRAHGLSAAVAGTDVSRAGAPQQLTALGNAVGMPVTLCYAPGELQAMVQAAATEVIVVDTPGHNGARRDRMTELRAFVRAARRRQLLLVLPATMKRTDLEAATRAYAPLEPRGLVLTRCDETTTYGALVAAAAGSGLGVAYTAHGDAVGLPPRGGDNLTLARAVVTGAWPDAAADRPGAPRATGAAASQPSSAPRARTGVRAGVGGGTARTMPVFIDLTAGMRIHVLPAGGTLSNAYESTIRQVSEAGIRIDHPRQGEETMELTPGDDVALFVQHGGRIYRLLSRVRLLEQIPLDAVVIEHPTEADHSERRQFYRLLTTIQPRYAARTDPEGEELERLEVRILDLSGGGMQLQTRQWVPVGSRLRMIFALEEDPQEIDVSATVLSVVRPAASRSFYRVHTRFADLPRAERERIVRFVFRKQIDFRKKGVG